MKAIIYTEYGSADVLQCKEIDKPVPKKDEVLIRIHATSVTAADINARGFVAVPRGFKILARLMFGIRKPKKQILGFELAGKIEAIGKDVTLFKAGDEVFGMAGAGYGAYAEYMCLPEKAAITGKPATMSFEEAAVLPFGGHTALYFLREAKVQAGQKVLVYGASGSVGTAAVQLAKYFGAVVTGVCGPTNQELVKSLGADKVIDYSKEDFTEMGESYDIIFETVGKTTFSHCKKSLNPKGLYIAGAAGFKEFFQMMGTSIRGGKKIVAGGPPERKEDLQFLAGLFEAGKYKAVIDRRYSLEQMAEAHRYVDKGHKKGNVVITTGIV